MGKKSHQADATANIVRPSRANAANGKAKSVVKRPSPNGHRSPGYDAERRELRLGNRIVKCLTQASDAVEIILLTFEEEQWPYRIDDPLPVKDDEDPKRRLATAVANLNRRQREPLIQFGVACQGTAVTWQLRNERA